MKQVVKCYFCPEPATVHETNWNKEVKWYCKSCYTKLCDPPPLNWYTSAFFNSCGLAGRRRHKKSIGTEWNGVDDNLTRNYEECR